MHIVIIALAAALLAVLSIILLRTLAFRTARPLQEAPFEDETDMAGAARNLSEALKIRTVSCEDYEKTDFSQFAQFLKYLEATYPNVYAALEHETVNSYSMLYRWKGSDPGRKPVLLMAHYDVVPVEESSEANWVYPPFSGEIKNGMVWGRGALDVKCQVTGILEAIEALLAKGYVPKSDIYVAFGHDEEVDGQQGARNIAALLEKRGLQFEFILDEGSCIAEGFMQGISRPLALVAVCEKGYADVKLTSGSKGGHSSMPLPDTALGIVCEGVARLQKHQLPRRVTPPVRWFLNAVGPEMALPYRIIPANLWLFKHPLMKSMSSLPSGNAMLRTTTAATMAGGSPQSNVLPQKAWAVLNFRLLNGETKEGLLRHIHQVLRGLDIKVEIIRYNSPSAISSKESGAFKTIERSIHQVFPDALPAPYIMLGGSDSIKYESVCSNIFRFSPYRLKTSDMNKIHGNNECISIESMAGVVSFYRQLIRNL